MKKFTIYNRPFILVLSIAILISSCKKENVRKIITVNPVTLSLVQYGTSQGKRVFMPITKVGTQTVEYYGIFDTGSTGMTLDATDIIPASMITSSGISFNGDSTTVNGITIMAGQSTISYGDKTGITKEYGYLAYTNVTLGSSSQTTLVLKRIPIFLYYKVVDGTGTVMSKHSNDVFGVGPGVSYTFNALASPLSYFDTQSQLSSGFKLGTLKSTYFTSTGTIVPGLLTIGLTNADLNSSGFIMHTLKDPGTGGGYSPNIPATITYGNKSVAAQVLFDTGTPSITVIEDKNASFSIGQLPANTVVKVTTNQGFVYQYVTTGTQNLTEIQNPNNTNDFRTIFSIDFFIENEILTDYSHHQIGLKNN